MSSKSSSWIQSQLSRIFAEYRSSIERHEELLAYPRHRIIRIAFRMEASKFYIDQLDFWDETGDMEKFDETAERA